jgi:AraC-like DNA-binding protein
MSQKPYLIWIEQLASDFDSPIPSVLIDRFFVRSMSTTENLDELISDLQPAAVFFDFDYPDRRRLEEFARIKKAYRSVPIVMLTLQHSESLATWAFRQGALDFLIKPVNSAELDKCVGRILNIVSLRKTQGNRTECFTKPQVPSEVPIMRRSKKDQLSPAVFFVQKNYGQRIYSDTMARLCGLSATHFSRAFKQAYEMTFQEFLLRYRIREARRMLRGPGPNIADVAYTVGFADPSYFTRVFKRYVGSTPSEFVATTEQSNVETAVAGASQNQKNSSSQIVRALTDTIGS